VPEVQSVNEGLIDCVDHTALTSVQHNDVLVTLPNEGAEDFEINQKLAEAIKEGVLTLYRNPFLLVCAKHLAKIHQGIKIEKGVYKTYAKMVVTKYPCSRNLPEESEENYVSYN
jgi:hypothetical protein